MTTKEKSAAIRKELKKFGFTSKQVSLKAKSGMYSSSFTITIKDAKISEMQINDIVKKFESIEYDQFNGEILRGANDFITVVKECPEMGSEYLPAIKKALAALEREGEGEHIDGTGWNLFKSGDSFIGSCFEYQKIDYFVSRFTCLAWEGVAESIAEKIAEKENDARYLLSKKCA